MATVNLTVKHRPVRIGFVVRAGEAIDLESVASFCALLWGGMHNPVIPVASADDASADLLVRAFQVDVLFNTAVNDATTGFIERYPPLRHPRLHARDLMHRDWKSKKDIVAFLDVLNAIDKYWEQDFKHAAEGTDSGCRLVTWDDADPLGPMFRIGFGAYDPDLPLLHNFEQAFAHRGRSAQLRPLVPHLGRRSLLRRCFRPRRPDDVLEYPCGRRGGRVRLPESHRTLEAAGAGAS
jgi:hypothetical protein